jgi:hypothetical protein
MRGDTYGWFFVGAVGGALLPSLVSLVLLLLLHYSSATFEVKKFTELGVDE